MTADLKQGSEPLGHHWKSAFEIRIAAPRARTGGGKVDRQELSPFKLVVIFSRTEKIPELGIVDVLIHDVFLELKLGWVPIHFGNDPIRAFYFFQFLNRSKQAWRASIT